MQRSSKSLRSDKKKRKQEAKNRPEQVEGCLSTAEERIEASEVRGHAMGWMREIQCPNEISEAATKIRGNVNW